MVLGTWRERYSVDCRLKYGSASTQKNYISQVTSFLARFQHYDQPKSIPTDEIKKWLLEAQTFNTRNHRLCAINSFYRLTVGMPLKTGKIPFPPREKKLPRIFDVEETKNKILSIVNKKHKSILAIGLCCGLRVSEVCNLKIEDILYSGLVAIKNGKGRKDRHVGISESCLKIIQEYINEFNPPDYLFEGQYGGKYSERSCEAIYHKYIDADTGFHTLRHICISNMVDNDKNILAIGIAVGHTNPKTTSAYYHISPKFLKSLPTAI